MLFMTALAAMGVLREAAAEDFYGLQCRVDPPHYCNWGDGGDCSDRYTICYYYCEQWGKTITTFACDQIGGSCYCGTS
jgi:hypothetical protein